MWIMRIKTVLKLFDERALTPPNLPSIWDPPGRHGAQLHELLHSTREKILDCLFLACSEDEEISGGAMEIELDP